MDNNDLMAGWDASEMMAGLPAVIDLAAASGTDLARTSDILTDGLTAFKLTAEDSTRFADVIAMASNQTNTNVEMLGTSFSYVAPQAAAMGYSIEQTAVALGVLANNGIKAEKGGTALRALLTSLSKPSAEAQKVLDKMGVSLTNTDGSMKDLNTVIADLRKGFEGLTEAEKSKNAATIVGKVLPLIAVMLFEKSGKSMKAKYKIKKCGLAC